MTAVLVVGMIAAVAVSAFGAIYAERAKRAAIAAATADLEEGTAEAFRAGEAATLAALRPVVAIADDQLDRTAALVRRFGGTDPTTAAEIARELHDRASDAGRGEAA